MIIQAISTEDLEWLRDLMREVTVDAGKDKFGNHFGWLPGREITEEEWNCIRELVQKHELPCAFSGWVYGGCIVCIYNHKEAHGTVESPNASCFSGAPKFLKILPAPKIGAPG